MTSADEFTRASPSYIAAQRTNQAKHSGSWDFSAIVDTAPWYVRALEVLFRPSSLISFGLLAGSIFLLVNF